MTLLLIQRLSIFKYLLRWRPIRKVSQFEKCITAPFKIDMNISIIYKTINVKIPVSRNQNTHTEETNTCAEGEENTYKGTTIKNRRRKNPIKGTTKIKQKTQNSNNKKRKKTMGCHQRRKMAISSTTLTHYYLFLANTHITQFWQINLVKNSSSVIFFMLKFVYCITLFFFLV